jgi:hypothetical protein
MKEYKIIPNKYHKYLTLVALFIPMPMFTQQPDFVIFGYGFGSSISIQKVPLGFIMLVIAILF